MFWAFLIVISLGTILINMGAMAMLLALLLPAFKVALVVILVLAILLVWRRR